MEIKDLTRKRAWRRLQELSEGFFFAEETALMKLTEGERQKIFDTWSALHTYESFLFQSMVYRIAERNAKRDHEFLELVSQIRDKYHQDLTERMPVLLEWLKDQHLLWWERLLPFV